MVFFIVFLLRIFNDIRSWIYTRTPITEDLYDRSQSDIRYIKDGPTISKETTTQTAEKLEKVNIPGLDRDVTIHFGPMNDSAEDYYTIEKRDCTLSGLGMKGVTIETQDKAQNALVTINDAIAKKDQARTYYGAMQNRLENTVSNLSIQAESLQAAESAFQMLM